MTTSCYAMVRGHVARFVLLDQRGAPVTGDSSVVVTKGVSEISLDEITDSIGDDLQRTDYDEPRVLLRGRTETVGFGATIKLTGVDPDLVWMLTGQPRVENAVGDLVGNDATLKLAPVNYAMEIWSRLSQPVDGCRYGYTLFPRLRGGRISGFSYGNSTVSFTITGARTFRANRWGYGPYSLRWNEGGWWDTSPWDTDPWDTGAQAQCDEGSGLTSLDKTVDRNLFWRNHIIDWAPSPFCGAIVLNDVIDNGSASDTLGDDIIDGGNAMGTSAGTIDGGWA